MSGLTVDVDIDADEDLFGLTVDDLQENITITGTAISGHLKYIDDYSTAFSGDEASGNYIAIHASVPEVDDVTITVTVSRPTPSTLDADGICVCRIADKSTQTITVVASKEGYDSVTKVYTLSGLTVDSET